MGAMPSFRDTLNQQQIDAVAEYVSTAAGGG
jgi:mono/diheme cytochrome c family protein